MLKVEVPAVAEKLMLLTLAVVRVTDRVAGVKVKPVLLGVTDVGAGRQALQRVGSGRGGGSRESPGLDGDAHEAE